MPSNWPELTLALSLALVAAYVVADLVARASQSVLRAIVPGESETRFVDRPGRMIRLFIFLITATALSFPALSLAGYRTGFSGDREAMMRWLLDHGLRIAVVAVAAYVAIRIGSAAARRFEREMSVGTLSVTVSIIAGLMVLRELGVDITPALTGAGIAGLAIGFGAQTLVRDVISGFFVILEDQVRVGDSAIVNGQGGLVEEVNLRTIVLRDEQGTVHVFPNGEIKTLANMSKDFAYYVITVGVAYDDDPDRVAEAMKEAGASLMADPEFQPHILAPLEIYGVDAFESDRMTVKGRIKTVPQRQWLIGRELRKRIARLFRDRGIDVPSPPRHVAGSQKSEVESRK
jgi:moderate conductance mechanosensitive channel